ncbi:MAG: DUF5069 domain-containing protein [Verrucomicrobium sp.]|nr:DUF5069 domain-containing protein [Verrucomicrobium sp.]
MSAYQWTEDFRSVYEKAIAAYREGAREAEAIFDEKDKAFLASIGHTAQEVYDFAEDAVKYGEPDFATAALIAAARRDYFLFVQQGRPAQELRTMEDFPAKEAAIHGIAWLPRLIEKARAKLRGEMPKDLMYGCGGDRRFLKEHDLHPADFLRYVWSAGEDAQKIVAYVEHRRLVSA